MKVVIASDSEPIAQRVRAAVLGAGGDCTPGHVVALDGAAGAGTTHRPDLTVIALSPHPGRGLAALEQLTQAGVGPVLVVGPTADSRLVLQAMRHGAADYVDEADLAADLTAALNRVAVGLGKQGDPARTIVVLAPSGGSGSSTVAANVATALAAKHKSALLLDLKLHHGDLSALLDLKPAHNLAELCRNEGGFDRSMFERSLAAHPSGVRLLAPPPQFSDVGLVSVEGVRQVLNLGRTLFPYVVVDLDNSFAPEQVQALQHADVILLVMRLDFTCLRNARRTLDYLDHLGIGRDRVRVVANRYGQAKEVPAKQAEEALGVRIAHYIPEDAKTVNRANNNGTPVVQESPSARVSRSLVELAASVNGRPKH
jgi:pilus assembly protein CpaE